MSNLHDLAEFRGRKAITRLHIVDVLESVGGAAHRDTIVSLLIGKLKLQIPKDGVTAEIDGLLRDQNAATPLFEQVWPDSYRWRLVSGIPTTADARAALN